MSNDTTQPDGLDKYDRARLLDLRIGYLCATLQDKLHAQYPDSPTTYALDGTHRAGTRFVRIVSNHSVHAFVDTTTGDLIKAATWKTPAKRKSGLAIGGNLLDDADFQRILAVCDPYGGYLYAR